MEIEKRYRFIGINPILLSSLFPNKMELTVWHWSPSFFPFTSLNVIFFFLVPKIDFFKETILLLKNTMEEKDIPFGRGKYFENLQLKLLKKLSFIFFF